MAIIKIKDDDGNIIEIPSIKGSDGKDGYTPVKGVDYFDGKDGVDGEKGADGYSPTATVTQTESGAIITITDKNGTTTTTVTNGKDGAAGTDYILTDIDKQEIANEVKMLVDFPTITQEAGESEELVMSQKAVTDALKSVTALPYGGSQEWLNSNGDTTKLYQIDGFIWGYIEATGWTKSNTQFLVVSSESEMINKGGTKYLLNKNNVGTVYDFTYASGDIGVPVCDILPENANDGDIVAVGNRKYKASLVVRDVPNFTDLTKQDDWTWNVGYRINSSGGLTELSNKSVLSTDFIPAVTGDVIRVKGLDLRYNGAGYGSFAYYDGNKENHGAGTAQFNSFVTSGQASIEGDIVKVNAGVTSSGSALTSKYQRFCGTLMDGYTADNIIVTVNEEITYTTTTITEWEDIGEYIPPVQEGWNPTKQSYTVINSLSITADNGEMAVYNNDGYLYTYIDGSAWMSMSEYAEPTLPIDKELSDTSVNAVQNKIVKNAIDNVEKIANSNAIDIDVINQKIANIESGNETLTIPYYWEEAVNDCIAKIKALQVGKNCITFPFFSDNHQRNGYVGLLIAYIMKECNIPYCFYGGDSISNALIEDEDTMIEQDKAFDTAMSYIPNGRFCRAVGNHDGYWNVTSATGDEYHYTREQVYELFLREESIAQNKHFGDDGTYYYVDDIASKVRFIILNTNKQFNENNVSFGESIDENQLAWLQNKALNFTESGWGVVFVSHAPITNNFHSGISNARAVQTMLNNYIAGTNENKADIIGWFSGHIHRDRIYEYDFTEVKEYTETTAGGSAITYSTDDYTSVAIEKGNAKLLWKTITIMSDYTVIAYDKDMVHSSTTDDKSHAIDFITINKTTKKVNLTRLGNGSDREYSY